MSRHETSHVLTVKKFHVLRVKVLSSSGSHAGWETEWPNQGGTVCTYTHEPTMCCRLGRLGRMSYVHTSYKRSNLLTDSLLTANSDIGRMGVLTFKTWGVLKVKTWGVDCQDIPRLDCQEIPRI
eukprot:1360568-Amorphochlora_amoeboformis.AAC.1